MLHLVYTFRPTAQARANQQAFWDWVRAREQWFYDGLDMVVQTRWCVRTIGADVHAIEHTVTFADEAAWGTYRAALRERGADPEWEARRATQEQWWEIVDARLLNDAPVTGRGPDTPPAETEQSADHATAPQSPTHRVHALLTGARFATLATTGPDGPWASTVNVVPLYDPLRLLWYSLRDARHSRNVACEPRVSAEMHLTNVAESPVGLDGIQLSADCDEITGADLAHYHHEYYHRNFPDPQARAEWMLPRTAFADTGPWRLYVAHVRRLWLFDVDRWLQDKHDTRFEVPQELFPTGW